MSIQPFSKKTGKYPTKHKTWSSKTIFQPCGLPSSLLLLVFCYIPLQKWVISPSLPPLPCLISLHHLIMRRHSSSPVKRTEESTVTVKTTCATSLSAPFPLWEVTTLVWPSWSKMLQYLPAPEGRNSFVLCYDSQSWSPCYSHLRPQRPAEAFLVNLGWNAINHLWIVTPRAELSFIWKVDNELGS